MDSNSDSYKYGYALQAIKSARRQLAQGQYEMASATLASAISYLEPSHDYTRGYQDGLREGRKEPS